MPPDLVAPLRREFTDKDRQRLAEYLVNFPSSDRTKKRIFDQAGAKLPGHTATSWHEHYRKTGREDVDRKIAKIVRDRERRRQARRDAAAVIEASSELDELDSEPEVRLEPIASTSKATSTTAARIKPSNSTFGSEQRRTPTQLDDDDGDGNDWGRESGKAHAARKTRVAFTDDDFDLCVKVMVQQEKQGFTNRERDITLAERCPDHTVYSWQSWISNNRRELDEAVRDYRKHRAERKLAKKDKRSRTADRGQDEPLVDMRNNRMPAKSRLSSDEQRQEKGSLGQRQGVDRVPRSNPAFAASDAARDDDARRRREHQAALQRTKQAASLPRQSGAGGAAQDEIGDEEDRPRHRLDKGKGRAISPGRLPSPPRLGRQQDSSQEDVASPSVTDAPVDRFSDFTDEDKHELVHQYARNLVKKHDPDTCFVYLGLKRPEHTEERWRAYFHYKLAEILSLVARKVQQIEESQAAKAKRLSASATAAADKEKAEQSAAAARREEARRRAEMEADERVARENEERFRREEERLDREKAERAREAAARRAEEAQRQARPTASAFVRRPAAASEMAVDSDGFDAASPSPEPGPFKPAVVNQRVLVEATPEKSSDAAATQTGLVRTPRHTPPTRASQEDEDEVLPGPADEGAGALVREGESDGEGSSPGSGVPRHSQYSVMPSPFIQSGSLEAISGPDDAGDEIMHDAAVKDETDDDHDLIITPAVEASRVRLDGSDALTDDDDDDDGTFWNALSPLENAHIHSLHALVAVVQQQQQQQDVRVAGTNSARARMAALKAIERLDDEPLRAVTGTELEDVSSSNLTKCKSEFNVAERDAQPKSKVVGVAASGKAPEPLASNPIASPSRKRRREASSPPVQIMYEHGADEAPSAKRQKLDEPAVAPSPQPASASRMAPEPARQARKSAPSALPARAIGTPTPTPNRRIPRASLAVMSRQATGSPAPEGAAPAAPSTAVPPAPMGPGTSTRILQAPAAPRPAGNAPPNSTAEPKPPRARSLADEIGDLARQYGVHRETIKHIMFCICAKGDMVNLAHLVKWFSPTHRPAEGTAEHEELRKLAQDQVWTLREDTIVLEGSDSALEQLARKRGPAAIAKRRHFLQRAKITSVGRLRKDLYVLT